MNIATTKAKENLKKEKQCNKGKRNIKKENIKYNFARNITKGARFSEVAGNRER
jgi:hypothetical protein